MKVIVDLDELGEETAFYVEQVSVPFDDNSLKAELVAILTKIQLEIEGLSTPPAYKDEDYFLNGTNKCSEIIQQEIEKYKAERKRK